MHDLPRLAPLCVCIAILTTNAAAGVLRVGGPAPDFADIQPAVDAAREGDTILVWPGSYAGFTITAKSLAVAGRLQLLGDPLVQGAVRVENLSSGQTVVLKGLDVSAGLLDEAALTLLVNQGAVRVENLDLTGGLGVASHPARSGAYVSQSADVAFTHCILQGGFGSTWPNEGGPALTLRESSVALHGSSLVGGTGAFAPAGWGAKGSRGGQGLGALQSRVFASALEVSGGPGGNGSDASGDCAQGGVAPGDGGDGGYGIVLYDSTDIARLAPAEIQGGTGGMHGQGVACGAIEGSTGPAVYQERGSTLTQAAVAPTLLLGPEVVSAGDPIPLFVYGEPGSRVILTIGAVPKFKDAGGLRGVQLAARPLRQFSIGPVPASGFFTAYLPATSLPSGVDAQTWYLQTLVQDTEGARFSGTTSLVVIDRSF